MSLDRQSKLAVTLGDPAGIGPEVILKALADPAAALMVTVFGSRMILQQTYDRLRSIDRATTAANPATLNIIDIEPDSKWGSIVPGVGNAASGAASFEYMEKAIARTLAGEFCAIVTGPISKTCWQAAGYNYPGQTELLAERSKSQRFGMLFAATSPHSGWTLVTLLATTHIPLRQVPEALTPELLSEKLELLIECLREDFGIEKPKIAISGLNPHSGENGKLGNEEQDWMIPWLKAQRDRFPQVQLDGLVPPDTMWVKPAKVWYGLAKEAHDGYLAMYHDQGLIPVKLMAFDKAVNTTIGLPFVRTSPDHGTAFDIVGQGIADASSMTAALQLAAQLASRRAAVKIGLQNSPTIT
ncbi:MAG: 4-hydroxythreonine-4-phosphate dehydrogenase PdxA [Microcoleus sp. PH2017_25_DOB_D_A]|uniref:4-hydroxythreonine-4-phosphate dehydrogenase PdxA n=1 Tax=unclassified Microcoleus TaxID=2642155 RepID=UPI001D587DBD|nr:MULTISPECIES: 4-hydroxythreonine-4-phosphate dehydrogenase PdxA [unclassified Microcoleus]MCC3535724.1 4-hydroxythreonine-4-phosphate dehydrogenase PdxA [Microcoleus sp. PH2017_25_DOB_D_A]MCC3547816.1 4-hydroxythreonine-4-phosphate dehydrogenase PdxA [Microcoleus sp. PH2017_24_DOB_U_A]